MMIIVGDLNWLLSLTKLNIVSTGFGELNGQSCSEASPIFVGIKSGDWEAIYSYSPLEK